MPFLKNKGSLGPAKLKKAITGAGLWVSSHRRWAFGGGVHAAVESCRIRIPTQQVAQKRSRRSAVKALI
jgi:hypothetical protein